MPENGGDEIPADDIEREFELAQQMLSDAKTADDVGISEATVINRLYYACFHAAQGALYERGKNPQSHGHVKALLGRELIKSGELPRRFGRFYNEMQTYRRRVDYGSGSVDQNTQELIEDTEAFLDAVRDESGDP